MSEVEKAIKNIHDELVRYREEIIFFIDASASRLL